MSFEKSMLAHLSDPTTMSRTYDLGLRPEHFEDPINQQVYAFIVDYWQQNLRKTVPPATVLAEEFPAYTEEPGEEAVTWLVETLQKRNMRNGVQDIMIEAAEQLEADPKQSVELLYQGAWQAKELNQPRFNRVDLAETVTVRQQRYVDRATSGDAEMGATYGLDEIDQHTGGVQPGELAIIVAATGVGKSFWLTHGAYEALKKGYTPIIFTLEQSIPEFEDRIDCWASGVGYGKLSRGRLNPTEHQTLMAAQEEMAAMGSIFVEKPERGDRTVSSLVNRARQVGANYIIIDQLSHMDAKPAKWKKDATERNSEIIFDLKDEIDRESSGKIPCMMAVQFNREASAAIKQGDKPELRQIANSADIERTVDAAFSLWRTGEMRANRTMIFDTMKARRSDQAAWQLHWELNNATQMLVRGLWEPEPS